MFLLRNNAQESHLNLEQEYMYFKFLLVVEGMELQLGVMLHILLWQFLQHHTKEVSSHIIS